jgi:hypothetical protein
VAIARAQALAERAGPAAEFIKADAQHLPDSLARRFDLVVADGRHILPRGPDGMYRLPFSDTHLPIMYSLRAIAPRTAGGS